MLADNTVQELLDAFSAPTPTPGGGSAAALAGAVAAALLAMVAGMPKTRTGSPEDRQALDAVHPLLLGLGADFVGLIDRDANAYNQVVEAYRLPKGTDAEKVARKDAIASAMRLATDVPLETARAAAALIGHGRTVAEHGNPNAKSDVGVAISLAMTAQSGAYMNVEINLGETSDAYATTVRAELTRLMRESAMQLGPAYTALGWRGHELS